MKCTLALALFVAGASALAKPIANGSKGGEYALRALFSKFEEDFGRDYTEEEREQKFYVFVENVEMIAQKNEELRKLGKDEVHGITKFSDMTVEEFQNKMLNHKMANPVNVSWPVAQPTKKATSSAFDWRDSEVVTSVKNQMYCGSCWAFSAVETVESQYAINGGDLTELSPQAVVSCDTSDSGCSGGWYYTAWMDYMEPNGGLPTEESYPYNTATEYGSATDCDSDLGTDVVSGTAPSSYAWATDECTSIFCNSQDEDTLKDNLVSYGPISIACDASDWSSYSSGVLTSDSCSSSSLKLDHAIQVVGYTTDDSTLGDYWIVRNSWGDDWGYDGYIYLAMNENTCGIADKAAMVYL
jgi:C1A family cysteine protease